MTRTKPSAIDLALIAEAGRHEVTVTATQLERWRQQLWLARAKNSLTPDSATELRPDVVQRVLHLAAVSTPGRSISWIAWTFWAIDDTAESATRLRNALVAALKRPLERAGIDIGQVPTGDSDEAFHAREDIAAQLLKNRRSPRRDLDGILRSHAAEAGVELPPARTVANIFHRALTEPGARLLVGGTDNVSFDDVMESWAKAWPASTEVIDLIRDAHREAALTGVDLMAQSPMAGGMTGLVRAVEQAEDKALCAAVRACTKASGTLGTLWAREEVAARAIPRLMHDVMWDQWVRVGGLAPAGAAGEAAIAISTIQYLLTPHWAEDLHRFQSLMEALLAAPAGDPSP
ncbi:hypothetical protein [Streptomyces sp. NBC_01244]|uniref:hypothetical protein n=1 Tax=Streptomyces sp. NBC_01244 TaxID=2903797 RepID=UPI002E11714A|nr:hypothetical protein OG247_44160 [Streptomyces sp. NBC_01244]